MLGSFSQVASAIKLAFDAASAVKEASAKMALAEVMSKLGDAQIQLTKLQFEIAELLKENFSLKEQVATSAANVPKVTLGPDGLYYTPDGDGPFCTTCYDKGKQLIRLTQLDKAFQRIAKMKCNSCGGKYT